MTRIDDSALEAGAKILGSWVEARIVERSQPGVSIGVVTEDGLAWSAGFGFTDVEKQVPATDKTVFRIASITKVFTATGIVQLRDDGLLTLDDPVADHLPWFAVKSDYDEAPAITIRHLLTHTAGIPRESPFPYWTDSRFPSCDEVIAALATQETVLPTETRWKYSNLGYAVLGEVIAELSGVSYANFIRERILEPLGMAHTQVETPDPADPNLARGYGRRAPGGSRSESPFIDCRGLAAAGNVSTTVNDMARFVGWQLTATSDGKRPLRPSSLREMQRVHWLDPDWQAGWGLGWRVARMGGETHLLAAGGIPGFRTLIDLKPADGVGVIVFGNADDFDAFGFASQVFACLGDAFVDGAPDRPTAAPDPSWAAYTGRYTHEGWGELEVVVKDGRLVAFDPASSDPSRGLMRFEPQRDGTFTLLSDDGFSAIGEPVVFEGEGDRMLLKLGENYYRKR